MAQTEQPVQENPEITATEPEKTGEFGDTSSVKEDEEKRPSKEFTPLDLGSEGNVSDWIVNMLSGRLMDFAISNIEWVGDWVDRTLTKKYEHQAEKRRMALATKEAAKNNQKAARKNLQNEDGTLDMTKADSIVYSNDDKKIVQIGSYKVRPEDKIVDFEGNPVKGTADEIHKQFSRGREARFEAEKQARALAERELYASAEQSRGTSKRRKAMKPAEKSALTKLNRKDKKSEKAPKKAEKKKDSPKKEPKRKSVSLSDAAKQLEASTELKKKTSKTARVTKVKKDGLKKEIEQTNSSKTAILNLVHNKSRGKTTERTRSRGTER